MPPRYPPRRLPRRRRHGDTAPVLRFALLLSLAIPSAAQDDAAPRRPNVLFLIADDLGAQALGCYGNAECRTPAIDRLAASGTRFERAYCQFPVCGPSRAALLTGLYPRSLGILGNGAANRLVQRLGDRPSLPQWFREHGWFSARIGKLYHMRVPGDVTAGVDGPDHPPSWDRAINCPGEEWFTPGRAEHLTNERLRFERDTHYGLGFGTAFYVVQDPTDGAAQPDAKAADAALAILDEVGDDPFFLAVGFVRPHVPLVAPETLFDAFPADDLTLAEVPDGDRDDIPEAGLSRSSERTGLTDPDRQRRVLQAYYASVAFVDRQVDRILTRLAQRGLAENTVVVFTSDHGYHLGEHDFWQKMSLHEESARIPLIVRAPGRSPAVTAALAQQIDLYPTLVDLAGLERPEHLQGASLVPVLDDPEVSVHDAVFCTKGNGDLVRTPDHALLAWRDGTAELYDMRADPRQFHNLADDERLAATRAALEARLRTHLEATTPR